MAKYLFPAIFTPEVNGQFSVHFPDIENCYTTGDDLQDAFDAAGDVLNLMLYQKEQSGESIPEASAIDKIAVDNNAIVSLIPADTAEYRRYYDSKAVKKTLTVPSWLNERAEKANAPFSQILQQGLKEYLHIQD